jgi:hypothetical protein
MHLTLLHATAPWVQGAAAGAAYEVAAGGCRSPAAARKQASWDPALVTRVALATHVLFQYW